MNDKTLGLIRKVCEGKTHIKLTVGTLDAEGTQTIKVYNAEGEIPNENYTYEIGSITKTFTASLLAKHIHEQKMSLDDSVSKYLDGLDRNEYYPTLKRLATHTAGYATHLPFGQWEGVKLMFGVLFGGKNQGVFPFKMDLEKMKRLAQEYKMEDKDYPWQYSNFGMALLGYSIGVASGHGYRETMNDFISNELGLNNSYTGTSPDKNLRGFSVKNKDIGNWVWGDDLVAPAGDISSTAADLLEYARIQLYREKPYLELCQQKHVESKKTDMGLGWLISKKNNNVLWHNGGTGAFRSFLGIDTEKKVSALAMVNYPIFMDKTGLSLLEDLQNKC
jgi:CubicO group peptidase (beta-lactamase class C family)